MHEERILNRAIRAQKKALLELRAESEELYQQAIEVILMSISTKVWTNIIDHVVSKNFSLNLDERLILKRRH